MVLKNSRSEKSSQGLKDIFTRADAQYNGALALWCSTQENEGKYARLYPKLRVILRIYKTYKVAKRIFPNTRLSKSKRPRKEIRMLKDALHCLIYLLKGINKIT